MQAGPSHFWRARDLFFVTHSGTQNERQKLTDLSASDLGAQVGLGRLAEDALVLPALGGIARDDIVACIP